MLSTFRFLVTLAVAGAWLLSGSAQHALVLHVAVAHPDHHVAPEPTHGHEDVVVAEADHSHVLALDLAPIARNGSGLRAPQATPAELPPSFACVGQSTETAFLDPDPNPPLHPLERHPSLRL